MDDITLLLVERAQALRDLPPPAVRRGIRLDAGLSAADCAAAVGCSRQALVHWEAGERTPRGAHLIAYRDLLAALQQAMAA